MLIEEPALLLPERNPILVFMAQLQGGGAQPRRIMEGVYEIGHYGGTCFMEAYEHWPEGLGVNSYGVCDNVGQLLAACPELIENRERCFVVTVKPVRRSEQEEGGWRWHKWGPYIGTQKPQAEYLRDEPEIEEILVYHIYEKVGAHVRPE